VFSGFGGSGLPVHPHSGIATHTTIMEGSVLYADSTGKSGTLRARGVEWMQAGGGVWHGGGPGPHDGELRGVQLWVALAPPHELAPAHSQYVDAASVPSDDHTRVLLGSYGGVSSAIPYPAPITFLQVNLRDVDGQVDGSVLYLERGRQSPLAAGGTRILWMDGVPICEPIVSRGPFVMNTEEEIAAAFRDLRAGKLGR
jgi:redox-sensitive bicupin YhaK (pirin superfamily)